MEILKKNVVLMGFMGSGKTVIGRQTARLLDFDFADVDEEIRAVTGMDLTKLYRKHGAIRFRSEERLVINKLAARSGLVIACGGALPPTPESMSLLTENGWCALLTADPAVIRQRLSRKTDRLAPSGRLQADNIAAAAYDWEKALDGMIDFRLDSGALGVEEAAQALADAFRLQVAAASI